jgi:GAF domain-containing protein
MATFQSICESLLVESGASRAVVQVARADGRLPFVAEAVTHGAQQMRNDTPDADLVDTSLLGRLAADRQAIAQESLDADPAVPRDIVDRYGARARVVAPVLREGRVAALVSIHDTRGPRRWTAEALQAVTQATLAVQALLDERSHAKLPAGKEELRDAALQAILDRTRDTLRVQRCTLRQNVSAAYAFPVTHESRAAGVRSLRGDFTIIQSGQPVIEKMVRDRTQVVQNDSRTASDEPLFHAMLKHYGDMRAQIVTPLFREDSLAAVLSVHSLAELRDWSAEETQLARSAARLLGLLIGATLA